MSLRIVLDCDGTITEGKYLEPPRTYQLYMALEPYDKDMPNIFNQLVLSHEVYIMTARSDYRADGMIKDWLNKYECLFPTAILTNIQTPDKYNVAKVLKADLIIDDSARVWGSQWVDWDGDQGEPKPRVWLMDNPKWKSNQEVQALTRIKSWKELEQVINAAANYREPSAHETSV